MQNVSNRLSSAGVLLVMMLLSATGSAAANWTPVALDKAGAIHEIDQETLRVEGALIHVWSKRKHTSPRVFDGRTYQSDVSKLLVKCAPLSTAMLQTTFYDSLGAFVHSAESERAKLLEHVPGSIGDTVAQFVCKAAAKLSAKADDERLSRQWHLEIANYKKYVKANEGIDYDSLPTWSEAWDIEVKQLANDPANVEKEGFWFLSEAHNIVKARMARLGKPN